MNLLNVALHQASAQSNRNYGVEADYHITKADNEAVNKAEYEARVKNFSLYDDEPEKEHKQDVDLDKLFDEMMDEYEEIREHHE